MTYAVVTEGTTANGDLSNLATIVPLEVPVAPADARRSRAKREGVVLTWTAPDTAISGAKKPPIAGYNIYRFPHGQPADEFATPVNTSPVTATTYTDNPPYGPHDYFVTALAAAGPPRIESDPSAAVSATFKDLVPPPPPTGLTALVETRRRAPGLGSGRRARPGRLQGLSHRGNGHRAAARRSERSR